MLRVFNELPTYILFKIRSKMNPSFAICHKLNNVPQPVHSEPVRVLRAGDVIPAESKGPHCVRIEGITAPSFTMKLELGVHLVLFGCDIGTLTLDLECSSVKLENSQVMSAKISASISSSVVITNSHIHGSTDDCIKLSQSSVKISGSSIQGSTGCAVRLTDRSNCVVSNTVIGTEAFPNNNGICAHTGSSVTINHDVSGHNNGIGVIASEGAVLYFNGQPTVTGTINATKIGSLDPHKFASQDDFREDDEHYSHSKKYEL
jgi:hypothetical protein